MVNFKVFVPFDVVAVLGGEVGMLAHEEVTDDVVYIVVYGAWAGCDTWGFDR